MSVDFGTTAYPGTFPSLWRGEAKVLPGDFKLKQSFAEGVFIPRGIALQLDFANMEASVVKIAKVIAGGSTTAPRVKKNSLLQVGDFVMKVGKTNLACEVTAIDSSNASYDVLTLDEALTTLTVGDYLVEVDEPSDAVTGVTGVYTLAVGTKPAAGDKLSLDGVVYEYAAAEGDAVFAIGSDAKGAAANIEDAVSAQYDGVFSVVAKNGKIIFTQLVQGVGDIPALVVTPVPSTGTLAATIAETTEGVTPVSVEVSPKYVPDAIVVEPKTTKTNGFMTVVAAYDAIVLREVMPMPDIWLTGFSLKNNPSIKYIKQ